MQFIFPCEYKSECENKSASHRAEDVWFGLFDFEFWSFLSDGGDQIRIFDSKNGSLERWNSRQIENQGIHVS